MPPVTFLLFLSKLCVPTFVVLRAASCAIQNGWQLTWSGVRLINEVFSVIYSNLVQLSDSTPVPWWIVIVYISNMILSLINLLFACIPTQKGSLGAQVLIICCLWFFCSTQGHLYNPYLPNMRRFLPYPYRCLFTIIGCAMYRSSYIMYVCYNYLSHHWRVKMLTLTARTLLWTYLSGISGVYKLQTYFMKNVFLCTQGLFGFCPLEEW